MENMNLNKNNLRNKSLTNTVARRADELLKIWKEEERAAYIHGWDFSHLDGRWEEERLSWDYREEILRRLKPSMRILDMDTGGGEFLLSLGHPYEMLAATEGYPPNVKLCEETLLPLGIDFKAADGGGKLPFADASFDMVLNRHGDFCPKEIYRVLKPGGIFLTQQVGAENDREFVELLLGEAQEIPFPEQYLEIAEKAFDKAGFVITDGRECRKEMRFFDTGALVWFARVLPWEFPDFSVEQYADRLFRAEEILQAQGYLSGTIHRYFLAAEKGERV